MNRRKFLRNLGVASAASFLVPKVLFSQEEKMLTGEEYFKHYYNSPPLPIKQYPLTPDECIAPGKGGTSFYIKLDKNFEIGDVLTHDPMYGHQIVVEKDPVNSLLSEFHEVKLITNDKEESFPIQFLKPGTEFYKVSHILGEYSTLISGNPLMPTIGGPARIL